MDKYIEALCKQKPEITLPCGNPQCKKEYKFKSKDVFKKKDYTFTCTACGKDTSCDTTKFAKDFVAQLKKAGITVK